MRALHPETPARALMWLALAVCISYANVLNGSFQFDDYNVIVNEPHVQSWANWFAALGNGIRPLLKFSYTLNWTIGAGTISFHLTNLLIHLANAWLVYRLAQSFVQQQWQQAKLQSVPLIVALLFAVHPVHTEAVSYISGRSASLMTLFYLAGFLSYIRGRSQDLIRHSGPSVDSGQADLRSSRNPVFSLNWTPAFAGVTTRSVFLLYVITPLCFLLALTTKETAVTFPLALLVWELCCGGRWRSAFRQMWPSWALLCITLVFFVFSDSYLSQMQRSAELNTLQGNFATQLAAFAYLMQQWLLPLQLNIDPDLPLLHHLSDALLPLATFMAMIVSMLFCWRKRPWISFALAWAMLQLIPLYLLLPRIDIGNERQLYLASWPLLLALVIEMKLWLDDRLFRVAAGALLLGFICLTISRNQVYADEISLWEDTVQKSPHKARVHNNLGHAYLLAMRYDEARREFATALELDPQLFQARYNLFRADDEIGIGGSQY